MEFTTEDVTRLILGRMVTANKQWTLSEIEQVVDKTLTEHFPSLLTDRQVIIDEIQGRLHISIGSAEVIEGDDADHLPWLHDADKDTWTLWPRLESYLGRKIQLPFSVIKELDLSTDLVLERLESPLREGEWDRRGLVFGHVQSGKTTHYSSLISKALDAGYQIIIVLAGTQNSLRSQTQERVDEYVIGRPSKQLLNESMVQRAPAAGGLSGAPARVIGVGNEYQVIGNSLELPSFDILTLTTSANDGDFLTRTANSIGCPVSQNTRLVVVVKKWGSILLQLTEWLRNQNAGRDGRVTAPALVIDDEADHASVNTKRDPDADPTIINRRIRQLLASFSRVSFVGYTATPQANIFIPPATDEEVDKSRIVDGFSLGKDLFPENFIVNLKAPSNYIGPAQVFGLYGDDAIGVEAREPLPMYEEVGDSSDWLSDRHKRDASPGVLPASLKEAMKSFVLACAIRDLRGDDRKHNSMLVHVTRYIDVQKQVKEQIQSELDYLQRLIVFGAQPNVEPIRLEFERIFLEKLLARHAGFKSELDDIPDLPGWVEVWPAVKKKIRDIQVMMLNGDSDDALAYSEAENGLSVIAIGGDKLSRGLTLEGLSVSYFLRTSKMADTLLQMGRWFGYRPRYADLCRVYTQKSLYRVFREIAMITVELQNDLDDMAAAGKSPWDYGLKIRTPSDRLLITAAGKIRSGQQIDVRFAGELPQAQEMYVGNEEARRNMRAVEDFITEICPGLDSFERKANNYVWRGVDVDKVLAFLQGYEAVIAPSFFNKCEPLRSYIADRKRADELIEWTVVLASKSGGDGSRTTRIGPISEVTLVNRKVKEYEPGERLNIHAIVAGEDEVIGLDEEECRELEAKVEKDRLEAEAGNRRRRSKGIMSREIRSVRSGLILIYPIQPTDGYQNPIDIGEEWIPSVVLSFPPSAGAPSIKYTVNSIYRRQYGLEWEENDE